MGTLFPGNALFQSLRVSRYPPLMGVCIQSEKNMYKYFVIKNFIKIVAIY